MWQPFIKWFNIIYIFRITFQLEINFMYKLLSFSLLFKSIVSLCKSIFYDNFIIFGIIEREREEKFGYA